MVPPLISSHRFSTKRRESFVGVTVTFWLFGVVCMIGAAGGNPRNIVSRNISRLLRFTVVARLGCMPQILCGLQFLANEDHGLTAVIDRISISIGAVFIITVPLASIGLNFMYSQLPDQELADSLRNIFISLPNLLGITLFLCATGLRCLMKARPDDPGSRTVWNPLVPSTCVSIFVVSRW